MLKVGEILELKNNKKYAVAQSIKYLDENYCYLVNLNNYEEVKTCLFKNNNLFEINDRLLLDKLEGLFLVIE